MPRIEPTMLTLRNAQLNALLADNAKRTRIANLARLAHVAWPVQLKALTEGDATRVESVIQDAFARAKAQGFDDPDNSDHAERFVRLLLQSGRADFDESCEWAAIILGWPQAEADLKIAALEKRARIEAART